MAQTDVVERTDQAASRADELRRLERREGWIRRLPLLPALIFTIVVTQIPFLFSLGYSTLRWRPLTSPDRKFLGIDNYVDVFTGKIINFDRAIIVSIVMTVAAVLLSVFFGLLLALLLDRKFIGQGLIRTLIITPFLIMPVVASGIWKNQLYDSTFGLINWTLEAIDIERIGLNYESIEFATRYPLWSVVAVLVWQWTPFMMLILLAGLQGQNPSVLEAARVDGAKPTSIFFQITLPQLRPYLELGILLGSIYLIQVFDHVQVIAGGQIGAKNVPHFIHQAGLGSGTKYGQASALSVLVVIASIVLATFGLRVLSGLLEGEEAA